MRKTLLAIVNEEDKEENSVVKIYWNGKKIIDSNGDEIMDGQNVCTAKQAVERAYALWGAWQSFNCILEYKEVSTNEQQRN